MLKLSYLMAIVPMAVLLTVSFFVLFTVGKTEEKWLKAFGYVVAGFLCLAAIVTFSGVAYKMDQRSGLMKGMMQQRMKMGGMPQMTQNNNQPNMVMPQKGPLAKDQKRLQMPKCEGNKGIVSRAE